MKNLKDVSVEIPKRRLTVFTGVSGSTVGTATDANACPYIGICPEHGAPPAWGRPWSLLMGGGAVDAVVLKTRAGEDRPGK